MMGAVVSRDKGFNEIDCFDNAPCYICNRTVVKFVIEENEMLVDTKKRDCR